LINGRLRDFWHSLAINMATALGSGFVSGSAWMRVLHEYHVTLNYPVASSFSLMNFPLLSTA